MQTHSGAARPRAYGWIAVLALAWNLFGLAMFFAEATIDGEQLMALPEAQRAVHLATPGWVNLAFAFAVIGGVLGALCLLLRRRWAVPMFAISLLALLVQVAGTYAVTPAWAAYGAAGLAMPALLLVVALLLWNHARRCRARAWLR